MTRVLTLLFIVSFLISCAGSNVFSSKIKVSTIQSIDNYYVFQTNDKQIPIVLGEKDILDQCNKSIDLISKPFIRKSIYLKDISGRLEPVKYLGYLDEVKIKKSGSVFVYLIENCDAIIEE